MTIHSNPTLSTSEPTRLSPNGVHSGVDITIQNLSDTSYVYLGGENVEIESFGYRLAPGAAWSVELPGTDALYAVGDTNGQYIAVLQTGLEG
jgi:hypothetical protein